jgi:serine protease inhibitor ecotin
MPAIIKAKTLYQLTKFSLDLLLARANKTRYKSIISQIKFEKKVIEFGCQFHPDYSFKNARNKVLIVDPYGEAIEVSPFTFKNQPKPPKKSVKRDLEEKVIERDWSLADDYEFVNSSTKVNLVCPNGHKRKIAPPKFRAGQGCAICAGNVPYTTETFIEQARAAHGERYDYSKTAYPKNNKLKLTICCREHGDFEQTASDHINQRSGCQKCKADITSMVHSQTHDQFMAKVNAIHGDTYLYNKTKYVKSDQHITITCHKHGDFKQLPTVHINGSGCPICGKIAIAEGQRKTKEQYIREAKTAHGDYYDYSLVDYVSAHSPIKIICPKHGEFKQTAGGHLSAGCRLCANERSAERQRLTTEEFKAQARAIHGDYYDYSLVDYKGNKEKVTIICLKHGMFEQAAGSHTNQESGCIQCGFEATKENQTKSTEQFIIEAQSIHGDTYDYSMVEYKSSVEAVTIICAVHGSFIQKPSVHLTGAGCRECGFERSHAANTFSQEDFLARSYTHHQYKYDYSKTVYTRAQEYVTITCRKHGDFEQLANSHMIGMGCRKCGSETLADSLRLSTEEFIAKAQEVHGSKYDYSLVDYKSAKEKVIITCPKHGKFEQVPSGHLFGGCLQCTNEHKGLAQRRTTENFISDAMKIHSDLYDYSETEYSTALDKVKIICRTHGAFYQWPRIHIKGSMCPQCSYGKGVGTYDEYYFERHSKEKDAPCKFYYVKFTKNGEVRYKVGLDSNNKRWGKMYRGWRIDVIETESTTKYRAWKRESAILNEFKDHRYRVKDEDFVGNGSTEMFLFDILNADHTV